METTRTLIIGASVAGLAAAACLQQLGLDYLILEKEACAAAPWRRHYERLHLHTDKGLSQLPYKPFHRAVPRYPSREQVVAYLEAYRQQFSIEPRFHTEVKSLRREGDGWIAQTTQGTFRTAYVIMATGAYGTPKTLNVKGLNTFPGKIIHSAAYQTGRDFQGQRVLVIGFGNSAGDIAVDLHEHGAMPAMAVRAPVNVIPRDLLGIPILRVSILLSKLPARVADALAAPLLRFLVGDITKLGLQKRPDGPFAQIQLEGKIPLLDCGTLHHIRQGNIAIYPGLDYFEGAIAHFSDGQQAPFDAVVAAVGYEPSAPNWLVVSPNRAADLKRQLKHQRYFGHEGLYGCGWYVGPTGLFREIGFEAQAIAQDIAQKDKPK
ncbi:flavin-containing monooxygenase [Hymenobacter jejuensis]|uniref:NAD(P)/FAD-dependent oxidoreductase n=1 Tax=Hymenobacter jejuensis TaxID=2502781 RepID=A0A5B7ZVG4_9BACT|nr:NAD(P)/FAD-dependent oxidoreductase [Hymenobacter jejuensis]QDA58980.1 NAD(P)/FAD-dependent oxidoreductase [Hymenobacter jejuensis]